MTTGNYLMFNDDLHFVLHFIINNSSNNNNNKKKEILALVFSILDNFIEIIIILR